MAQTNTKKTSYLSAINMDYIEAIIENSSVKSVRKLNVMLSFQDKQRFLNLSNTSINATIIITEAEITLYMQNNGKNELSLFLKTSFIFVTTSKYK